MPKTKRVVGDLFFVGQLLIAAWMCGVQFRHMMLFGMQGLSFTMLIFVGAFIGIVLWRNIKAHQNQPSRITKQNIAVFLWWTVAWGLLTVPIARSLLRGEEIGWGTYENISLIGTFVCVGIMWKVTHSDNQLFSNLQSEPMFWGLAALVFKSVPQLFQAGKIGLMGGEGLAFGAIIAGHVSIVLRATLLKFSWDELPSDDNRRGVLISEVGNGISWGLVLIVWLWWWYK